MSSNMRVLLVLCTTVASLQAFQAPAKNWSKVQPKLSLQYNPNYAAKSYPSSSMQAATVDMRAVCGQSNPPAASKIIGGFEAGVNEFPWQVALFIDDNHFCGGSLISDQWVLTAARCADGAKSYNVYLGAHNLLEPEDFRLEIPITSTPETNIIHPNWNSETLHSDVALIKLPQPIAFSDIIRPICLPAANEAEQHVGEGVIVAGWGRRLDSSPSISPVLYKTNVTVVSNTQCRQNYGDVITADHICTGNVNAHGTCNGDNGGPLIHVNTDGTFTQIGIVSFGPTAGCEAGYIDASTRVSNYMPWISDVTGLVY